MKILLAGDSTVTTQIKQANYNPAVCYCGWGEMLPKFFAPDCKVLNFAQSGLTVESFRTEGHYDKLNNAFKKKDFVLIQFGHNDQKLAHLRAEGGYSSGLQQYIDEINEKCGTPVLVTSVARNTWHGESGEYNDLLVDYSAAMKAVADKNNVPLLDLNAKTTQWIKNLGLQKAKRYFYPGDYTHPNEYGGFQWAFLLCNLIADSAHHSLKPLQNKLLPKNNWPSFNLPEVANNFGWTDTPAVRTKFEFISQEGILTVAEALTMAQKGYGYFSTIFTNEASPFFAYNIAKENGYLPKDFPAQMQNPVQAQAFENLLKLACKGRNALTDKTKAVCVKKLYDGTVLRKDAVDFALCLEKTATGSAASKLTENIPKGS